MPSLDTFRQLPARSKAAFAVAAVAILAITFFMLQLAGSPSYATLAAGLDPADTGKVTATLDEQGIGYELQANGTTVAVDKASLAQARVALATAGVSLKGGQKGFELFDQQKLGASDFQQKITYQRALEGEIARTISDVQGVSGATVQLVLPEDELFASEASPATAAVMLDGTADTLEAGAVRGIAQLVSSSVKGLKTENVTITDNAGQLLWPQGDGGAAGAAGATKQAAEARYERSLESNLNAMLARTLGPGKAQVQVKARLNVDKTTKDQLTYAKKGVPLEITAESERLRGGQARAGGAAGTAGNVPTYAAGGAGAGANSNYDRRTRTTKLGVDKLVSKTEVAPGQVERLQVSLLVDQTVPAATFQQLQNVVSTSAGLDATRGDPALTAMQVPFAQPAAAPKAGPVPVTLLSPLKWVGLGLATLIFLFFVRRNLRRREAEALPEPPWLAQIERPTPLSALEAGRSVQDTMVLPPREPNFQLRALDQMINEEPERVAAQVKSWMNEN